MGRGSSKIGGSKYKSTGKMFDEVKAGKIYQSLPPMFKASIRENLKPSDDMQAFINEGKGTSLTDEWTAGLKGIKEKRKVITRYENNRLLYTVKKGNKVLIKDGTVEQAANQVAMFYKQYLSKR